MAGPWEQFQGSQQPAPSTAVGPWSKFQSSPEAGQTKEEPGFARRVVESLPTAGMIAGGFAGGSAAGAASLGLGTFAGGVAGAGVGAAAGASIRDIIKQFAWPEEAPQGPSEAAKEIGKETALGVGSEIIGAGVIGPAIKGLGLGLSKVATKLAIPEAVQTVGKTIGKAAVGGAVGGLAGYSAGELVGGKEGAKTGATIGAIVGVAGGSGLINQIAKVGSLLQKDSVPVIPKIAEKTARDLKLADKEVGKAIGSFYKEEIDPALEEQGFKFLKGYELRGRILSELEDEAVAKDASHSTLNAIKRSVTDQFPDSALEKAFTAKDLHQKAVNLTIESGRYAKDAKLKGTSDVLNNIAGKLRGILDDYVEQTGSEEAAKKVSSLKETFQLIKGGMKAADKALKPIINKEKTEKAVQEAYKVLSAGKESLGKKLFNTLSLAAGRGSAALLVRHAHLLYNDDEYRNKVDSILGQTPDNKE